MNVCVDWVESLSMRELAAVLGQAPESVGCEAGLYPGPMTVDIVSCPLCIDPATLWIERGYIEIIYRKATLT